MAIRRNVGFDVFNVRLLVGLDKLLRAKRILRQQQKRSDERLDGPRPIRARWGSPGSR